MRLPIAVLLMTAAGSGLVSAQPAGRADIDRALAAVYPSLVRISVVTTAYSGGRELRSEASGSGTIVSADGYVVTNHHVAGHARRIVCTLSTQEEVPADLVGTDPLSDITVVKLRPAAPRRFPFAAFAVPAGVTRGDAVLALGSPLALSQSVTLGIVSNAEMVMPRAIAGGVSLDGEDVGSIVRWIGHDAAIYPGNSGGPLVNLKGEIVGVNELSFGLAAAIPSDVVKPVVDAIVAEGRVRRGWIGLELQPRLSRERHKGALVSSVEEGSPAAAAGVESGDLIVAINASPIDVQFAEQLPLVNQVVASLPVGRPTTIEIWRAGASKRLSATPAERAAAAAEPLEVREWGIVASGLTSASIREMGRTSASGARVLNVRAGGAAQQAKPPIEPDDVIVDVDGKPVNSAADLESLTDAALASAERASVLVTLDRRQERRLTVVDLSRAHADDPPLEARKSWLAIAFQALTPPLAQRLGLPGRTGVRVTRVMDPSVPLRVGDIILAVDGAPVRASAPGDEQVFTAALRQYGPGAAVPLTIWRDGAEQPVTVTVRPAPRQPREMRRYDDAEFGFRAREISEVDRDEPRFKGVSQGVVVDAVEPGGWAALARLGTGDVIVAVDGQPVADVDALADRIKAAAASRQPSVVLRVRRGVRTVFVELEPSWSK
jgi:serine protease Do